MNKRQARAVALAGWCLEMSALLFVFPVIDQVLIGDRPFRWGAASVALGIGLILFVVGLYLSGGESK